MTEVFAFVVMAGMVATLQSATPPQPQPQHVCPAPRTIILVRCPGPHEITTQRISCKTKRRIDECATWAQGEGRGD